MIKGFQGVLERPASVKEELSKGFVDAILLGPKRIRRMGVVIAGDSGNMIPRDP